MSSYFAQVLARRNSRFLQLITPPVVAAHLLCSFALLAASQASAQASAQGGDTDHFLGAEYVAVGYTGQALHNPVAQLAARVDAGEAQLPFNKDRLHLDSLLEALDIDPASQVLVYSRTSLQGRLIAATAPRALYFNDTTYVGWIPGTAMLEIAATDTAMGTVFYTLRGSADTRPEFQRHTGTCLICHDTYSAQGGGVPVLMAKSVLATRGGAPVGDGSDVTDVTPIDERWGGWYVTGQHGSIDHLGNIILNNAAVPADLQPLKRGNLDTLEGLGLFDTDAYLTPTSDIVALLVLEHQLTVHNQITYVKFKAPAVLGRAGFPEAVDAETWAELPPRAQTSLTRMLTRLTDSLLFVGAAPIDDEIVGTSGFDAWFELQGPRDRKGRSLRELELNTRLLRYPLSYLIHSPEFDALPAYAKDYVYLAIADALNGRSDAYAYLTSEERETIHEILVDTRPAFARY
jgi:hypothetical protein